MSEEIKKLLVDCANFIQPYDDGGNEAERLITRLDEAIDNTPFCSELAIYMTYDSSDSEVFAAFTDKERCELESQEGGVPMQKTTLYFGKRN